MAILAIEYLNTDSVQDTQLLAAVSGQTHKINAITITCEAQTDNKHANRWMITDGQLYDVGTLAPTGASNVADGEIVTVVDNAGNTVVYEFDNDASVSDGRTLVTIGAAIADTMENLNTAIAADVADGTLFLKSSWNDGADTVTLQERTRTGSNSITTDAANVTVVDFTGGGGTIMAQGFAWNHTPVVIGNFLSTFCAGTANTALRISIETVGRGFNVVGNVYYTTSA